MTRTPPVTEVAVSGLGCRQSVQDLNMPPLVRDRLPLPRSASGRPHSPAVLLLGLLLTGGCLSETGDREGPTARRGDHQDAADSVLVERERAWLTSLRQRNAGALYRLLASDFRMTRPDSAIEDLDRERYVGVAMDAFRLDSFRIVRAYARRLEDVGFVDLSVDWYGELQGRTWRERFRWRDVWVRRDGRWQAVLRVGRAATAEPATPGG